MIAISETTLKKLLEKLNVPDISFLEEYFLEDEQTIQLFDGDSKITFFTNKRIIMLDTPYDFATELDHTFKIISYKNINSYTVYIPTHLKRAAVLELMLPDIGRLGFSFKNRDKIIQISNLITEKTNI